MEYHLDRKIRLGLKAKPEHRYDWCLQELDENDKQIGRDLTPWEGRRYFSSNEVFYSASIGNQDIGDKHGSSAEVKSAEVHEIIYAKLRPGYFGDGNEQGIVKYSMLGASRTISRFLLRIEKAKDSEPSEGCGIWGGVGHTWRIDSFNETTDDVVEIWLYLSVDKFDNIAEMIKARQVDGLLLSLADAPGFYVEWPPSRRPSTLKLLSALGQEIIDQDDSKVVPPRLGDVGEFNLQAFRRCAPDLKWSSLWSATDGQYGIIADSLKEYLEENLPKVPEDEVDKLGFKSQFNDIAKSIGKGVARYSTELAESRVQFENRLWDSFEVLKAMRYATNEKARANWPVEEKDDEKRTERERAEHTIWRHGDAFSVFLHGYKSEHAKDIHVEGLELVARRYLLCPWMENETLELMIVDALAFATVTRFGEQIKKYSPATVTFFGLDMVYPSAEGDVRKMIFNRMKYRFMKLAAKTLIYLGVPAILGWFIWNLGHEDFAFVAVLIYFGIFSFRLAVALIGKIFERNIITPYERFYPVFYDMSSLYEMLKGEGISPIAVRDRLLDTGRRGAPWPAAMYAMLEHVVRRNPVVWCGSKYDGYQS